MLRQRAIFPGSFDPLTNGHVDVIERCLTMFPEVVVSVLSNPSKDALFSVDERMALIAKHFSGVEGVSVASFSGLLVEFALSQKARIVVRGLRAISDFDYEAQMALINRSLDSSIETLFLMAREANSYISSSVVKQIAPLGADVGHLVPPVVDQALRERFQK